MSFQLVAKRDLIALVNAANGTAFVDGEVVFSAPTAVTGEDKNTSIFIGPAVGSKYKGVAPLTYDRIQLSGLHEVMNFRIMSDDAQSVHELFGEIKRKNGVMFTADDLEDSAVVVEGDVRTVTLTAKPGSLGWLGSSTFTLLAGEVTLADILANSSLTGLNYPTDVITDTFGQMYLTGYDFTPYGLSIKALPTGVLSSDAATSLVATLKAVDVSTGATLWNTTAGATAWSLQGATVISNGLNTDRTLPTHPSFKYVMVLELRSDVPKPKGRLYVHYNEPFDPTL